MSFLQENCTLHVPNEPSEMLSFSCGDEDLDGFKTVFSTDEEEKTYRHISNKVQLSTRLMYFDLMSLTEDNL